MGRLRRLRYALVIILLADVGVLVYRAMAAVAPSALIPGYESYSSRTWLELVAADTQTAAFVLLLFWLLGAYNAAFAVLAIAIAATAFSLDSRTAIAYPGIASCGSVNPFAPKPMGRCCGPRIGVMSLYANGRWSRPCDPALSPCLAPDRDAPDPAGQGGHGSTTAPPAPRCSCVQRSGPCGRWLDRVGTVARNGMWVRRSVAIGNQPGSDSLFENPS